MAEDRKDLAAEPHPRPPTHAEDALRDQAELLRTLGDNLPDGFIYQVTGTPDGARRFTYVSAGVERLFGVPRAEALADAGALYGLIHPDDVPRVEAAEAESLAQTKPFDCEFRVRTRAGAEHWVHCRSAPQRLSDGSVAWVGLLTDVTAGKRAEEEAREEARRKDKFISMLAHELRNPLAPIGNAMHLLARSRESAVVDKVQDIVTRQVAHLSRVVDDLLDASRVARGQAQLRRERVDLGRVARQASEDQAASFGKARVALAADVPDTPVWVEGDRTRLTQVVTNLLANAAKFTDRGGRATVGVRRDRGQAVLTVADTGVGMDAATLARLFEPFAQADQSLARTRGGLGLGLALVKGFVELHDGTVTAASAGPGKGSEFTVRLPLAPEPPAVTAAPLPAARPAPVRKRVLIVEDNKDAADSLRMVFEMTGYDVTVAYTGPDGAEAARRVRPDLVICDIGLPGMDGYAVARRIRADLAAERPVLVALTGYGEAADRDRALAAGFDRHFTKPADPAALEAALTTRT